MNIIFELQELQFEELTTIGHTEIIVSNFGKPNKYGIDQILEVCYGESYTSHAKVTHMVMEPIWDGNLIYNSKWVWWKLSITL